jgi:hypothetical protein
VLVVKRAITVPRFGKVGRIELLFVRWVHCNILIPILHTFPGGYMRVLVMIKRYLQSEYGGLEFDFQVRLCLE